MQIRNMCMKIVLIIYLITSWKMSQTAGKSGEDDNDKAKDMSARIIGGTKADFSKYTFITRITRKMEPEGSELCGGSILTEEWVLTAAHCVVDNDNSEIGNLVTYGVDSFNVYAGTPLRVGSSSDQNRQKRGVKEIHPHNDYTPIPGIKHHDIAVMKVDERFKFTDYVQPVKFACADYLKGYNFDIKCYVAGWGWTGSGAADNLQEADLPLVDASDCAKKLKAALFEDGTICAGYVEGGKDSCQGDSGGPLVCDGVLTGVVSGGLGCAEPDQPGVYMYVGYYVSWMESTVNEKLPACHGSATSTSKATASEPSKSIIIKAIIFVLVVNFILCKP